MLSKPIDYEKNSKDLTRKDSYKKICTEAVNNLFTKGDGKELLQTLCPTATLTKMNSITNSLSNFELANPIQYMIGFLFASGCALSGNREYASGIKDEDWYPNHYMTLAEYPNKDQTDSEYKGSYLPYCITDKIEGKSSYALSVKESIDTGTVFGA